MPNANTVQYHRGDTNERVVSYLTHLNDGRMSDCDNDFDKPPGSGIAMQNGPSQDTITGADFDHAFVTVTGRGAPHSNFWAKHEFSDHQGIRRDPVIAAIQSSRETKALAYWQSAHLLPFGRRSAAERRAQTLQRLIRVPQLARDSIVVLTDLRQVVVEARPRAAVFKRERRNLCPHAITQGYFDRRTSVI